VQIISIDEILKIARDIIKRDNFCVIKNLDNELQKLYIVNCRTKMVYFKLIVDFFRSEISNNLEIEYLERKYMDGKRFSNLLVKK